MSGLVEILRGIAKLFIEDEFLAVGIVAVVGLAAVLVVAAPKHPFIAGLELVGGNIAVLVAGTMRYRRRGRRMGT
jgi:CBS-domain-containing membrane protein